MTLSLIKPDTSLAQVDENLAGLLAPSSMRIYRTNLQQFQTWLPPGTALWDVTREQILAYRRHVQARYPRRETAQYKFSIILRVFREAQLTEGIAEKFRRDPTNKVPGIKTDPAPGTSKHQALSKEQVRALLAAAECERDYLILLMLLKTALRRAELASIRLGMLEPVGPYWHIIITGKGRKRREIKIVDSVKAAIDHYLITRPGTSDGSPLFPASTRNHETIDLDDPPLSTDRIYAVVRRAGRAIGIPSLTAHSMRATWITTALESGAALQDVQAFAGHADPRTTERYNKRANQLHNSPADHVNY